MSFASNNSDNNNNNSSFPLSTIDWFPLKIVKPKKQPQQQQSSQPTTPQHVNPMEMLLSSADAAAAVASSNGSFNNNNNNESFLSNNSGLGLPPLPDAPPNSEATLSLNNNNNFNFNNDDNNNNDNPLDMDPSTVTSLSGMNLGAMMMADPTFLNQKIDDGGSNEDLSSISFSANRSPGGNNNNNNNSTNNNHQSNSENPDDDIDVSTNNNKLSSGSFGSGGGAFALTNSFTFHFKRGDSDERERDIIEDVTAMSFLAYCHDDVFAGGDNNNTKKVQKLPKGLQKKDDEDEDDAVDEYLNNALFANANNNNGGAINNGAAVAAADKTGRITVFAVEPSVRKENRGANREGRLQYRMLSIVDLAASSSDNDNEDGENKNNNNSNKRTISPLSAVNHSPKARIEAARNKQRRSVLSVRASEDNNSNINTSFTGGNDSATTTSTSPTIDNTSFVNPATSTTNAYKGRLSHQAFSLEQDRGSYPPKKPVDERVTCIVPISPQMTPHSVLYLASNDIIIKLYRLRSYRNAVVDESSQPFTDDVILPLRTFISSHTSPIKALSTCADQETFLSADGFKIQWWNLENDNPNHGVTLFDMRPSKDEDITEVLTNAAFHPTHNSLFLAVSSSGACRIGDLRDPPSRKRKFSATLNAPCENNNSNIDDFTSRWTNDKLISRALRYLHGGIFLDDQYHVVTRDYMTLALWDLRMVKTNNNINCSSKSNSNATTTASGLITRRSVGQEHLIPNLSKYFDSGSIFDQFPLTSDIQQFHNNNNDGPTVATGLYGHSVLFWKDPVRDVATATSLKQENSTSTTSTSSSNMYIYSLDEQHYEGGKVLVNYEKRNVDGLWNPISRDDKQAPTNDRSKVTQLSINANQVAYSSPSKIVRLDRRWRF